MKNQILIALVTIMTSFSAFADKENSRLQSVVVKDCSQANMVKTINDTANWVMFDKADKINSDGRTNLETALMSIKEKQAGASAKVFKVVAPKNIALYNKKIQAAVAAAEVNGVAVAEPVPFQVVYAKTNTAGQTVRGRVILSVACRIEKTLDKEGVPYMKHTAQLIEFEVKPKGVK